MFDRDKRKPENANQSSRTQTSKVTALAYVDDETLGNISTRKVLLVGETVFASLTTAHPATFVAQAPRDGAGYLRTLVAKSAPKIQIAIDQRLLDLTKCRFALAIDGYLAWGFAQRDPGTLILFGGGETQSGTSIDILVFQGGVVQAINEKNLPAMTEPIFTDAVEGMIAGLRNTYPTARFVQASPLQDWGLGGVEFIGNAPLKRLSYRPLLRSYSSSRMYVLPAAIAAGGFCVYLAMLTLGWSGYNSALNAYETAIADAAIKDLGGIDTNFLDVMNARRFFMDQPRRQIRLTQEAIRVVRGVGVVPDVQIMEIKLPAPSLEGPRREDAGIVVDPEHMRQRQQIMPDRTPDVWMSISVPLHRDTAILQAKDVMTSIANSTGMSLRLAHQGWRESSDKSDGLRRVFNIEGFIHD